MDRVEPAGNAQLEGLQQFHIEAAEEAAQHEQQHDRHHHHFGHLIPAALLDAFADQDAEHQAWHGVAHDQLRQTAENRRPEARFFAGVDGRQPEDHRHDGIDQQVCRRYQHFHRGYLQRGRHRRGGRVQKGNDDHADNAARDGHLFRVVQGFGQIAVFHHQRGRAPVRNDAVVDVLSEGACRNG